MSLNFNQRRLLAIGLAPIIGEITFVIIFSIFTLIDSYRDVIHDGPEIPDNILWSFFFPILFICAFIFQILILEPLYFALKSHNLLNRFSSKWIAIGLTMFFTIFTSLIFWSPIYGFNDFMQGFIMFLIFWSSYFIPNYLTYYYLYIKKIELGMPPAK